MASTPRSSGAVRPASRSSLRLAEGSASANRLPRRLDAELLAGNGREKRDDIALDFDFARFPGFDQQIVLELAAAEGLVAQTEDEHFVSGAAQRNLFRRNVLDDEEDFSIFFLFFFSLVFFLRLALPFLFRLSLFARPA